MRFVFNAMGYKGDEAPDLDPMVKGASEEAVTSAACPGTRRQALRFPTYVLIALGAFVMREDAAPYARAYAWWVLVCVWAVARFDDHRGIVPVGIVETNVGYRLLFGRTKTPGAGKPMPVREAIVAKQAYLSEPSMETGPAMWRGIALDSQDYFLCVPSPDMQSALALEAT